MQKKIAALLLVLCCLMYGCDSKEQAEPAASQESLTEDERGEESGTKESQPLVLGCERHFFTHHPCIINDTGKTVVPLLYDGLVCVDEQYQWHGLLAQSIEQDGYVYKITLKEGAVFSNGEPVTAQDVVNSLEMAMSASSSWSIWLSSIQEYRILSPNSLQIVTRRIQRDFENLLTFPIAKQQSDGTWVGCGRYRFEKKRGDLITLQKNTNYHGENKGPKEIFLQELPNVDASADSLKIGKISCLFDDLHDGEAMNLSNRNQAVDINHIVFLGVNCKKGMTSDPLVRQALSKGIDRNAVVDRIYASKAKAAPTPLNPSYAPVRGHQISAPDTLGAQQLMKKAGYEKDADGFYRSDSQTRMTLLYNSENPYRNQTASLLRQQLALIGIELEPKGVPYEEYMQMLRRGEFDLYLGELAIGNDMDIRRLFTLGENYGYGCGDFSQLLSLYDLWQQGQGSLDSFLWSYAQELPAIPLLYRQGIVSYSPEVSITLSPSPSDIFANLSE